MLIKLLFVVGLIFIVGRNLLKLSNSPSISKSNPKKKKADDDAIDADYTVIDDDKWCSSR